MRRTTVTCDRCEGVIVGSGNRYKIESTLTVSASANGAPAGFELCDDCSGDLARFLEQKLTWSGVR